MTAALPVQPGDVTGSALPKVDSKPTVKEAQLFTSAKLDRLDWILRDPDPRMSPTAKIVGVFLLQCVNSETLQCNPSYRTIADVLGFKTEKTAERAISALVDCGWLAIRRFNRTKSNRYVFLANDARTKAIDDYQIVMADKRADDRSTFLEQTNLSGRNVLEQTFLSGPEQTNLSGKHLKGTPEVTYGYEEEERIKVSATLPYPIPESEEQLADMLANLFDGCRLSSHLMVAMRKMLMAGTLTPEIVDQQRRLAS